MFNFLLWIINLQTRFINKLSKLSSKDKNKIYLVNKPVVEIDYFCWCISDKNEIIGNPAVITSAHPQTAALKYYVEHVPDAIKIAFTSNGRTLTSMSRPISPKVTYQINTNDDHSNS